MNALSDRIGVQSYTFRQFKGTKPLIGVLRECRLNKLELSFAHILPTDRDRSDKLRQYRDNGITVTTYGVHNFDGNRDSARAVFEFARTAEFSVINSDLAEEEIPVISNLCREYQVRVAVHNHGRKHRWGPAAALEKLVSRAPAEIGLCLDTGYVMDCGEDPLAVARRFQDRLYAVHLKDFLFDGEGERVDIPVGEGKLKLKDFLAFLISMDFRGPLSLEHEGENPTAMVIKSLENIRNTLDNM